MVKNFRSADIKKTYKLLVKFLIDEFKNARGVTMNMDKVKEYSKKFMEKEYPDEAPYHHIAWEIFQEVMKKGENANLDLEPPAVRDEGGDTIMAPMVIQAFHTIFFELGEEIESSKDSASLKSLMMEVLSKCKFSPEFSKKIIDFILEYTNG